MTLSLVGCARDQPAGAVDVPAPAVVLDADDAARCAALVESLPLTLGDGLQRRELSGNAGRFAAWGDPAVLLECGVEPPETRTTPLQLGPLDGPLLSFSVRDVGAAMRYTARDLAIPVAVTVPDAYDAQLLVQLTPALSVTAARSPSPAPTG